MKLQTRLRICGALMAVMFFVGLTTGLYTMFSHADNARPAWHQTAEPAK